MKGNTVRTQGRLIHPSFTSSQFEFDQSIYQECLKRDRMDVYLMQLDPFEDAFMIELLSQLEECRRCQWAKEMLEAYTGNCASICYS